MKPVLFVFALAACGTDAPPLPTPIASVPGTLAALAVNDTSLFAIDTDTNTLLEIGLDGTVKPLLPTVGPIRELTATGNLVAWVETEGTGTVVKRRVAAGAIESQRTFDAHVIANANGLFYSDLGLIAVWADAVPERIATPPITSSPRLLDVDGNFAYTTETDTSVVKYARMDTTSEIVLPTSLARRQRWPARLPHGRWCSPARPVHDVRPRRRSAAGRLRVRSADRHPRRDVRSVPRSRGRGRRAAPRSRRWLRGDGQRRLLDDQRERQFRHPGLRCGSGHVQPVMSPVCLHRGVIDLGSTMMQCA